MSGTLCIIYSALQHANALPSLDPHSAASTIRHLSRFEQQHRGLESPSVLSSCTDRQCKCVAEWEAGRSWRENMLRFPFLPRVAPAPPCPALTSRNRLRGAGGKKLSEEKTQDPELALLEPTTSLWSHPFPPLPPR
eukprot:2979729-Rhodomonas_salina.2